MNAWFLASALGASLGFGIGDFLGGRASAKIPVVQVLVISELFGALMFWLLAYYTQEAALPNNLIGLAGHYLDERLKQIAMMKNTLRMP